MEAKGRGRKGKRGEMMGEEGRGEEGGGALPIYIPVYATDLYYRVGQKSCHFAFVYIFANY